MPELTYDLHIHSCLSPCGDGDMTPYNIAAMSALKGLDVIALTDHNSAKNCPALLEAAQGLGVMALPGLEVCTAEEVHAVCLFAQLDAAMAFDAFIYDRLIKIPNKPEVFGAQLICRADDTVVGEEPHLLINAAEVPFDELWDLALSYGGVMFPAHIERTSNSLLSNLGFIPPASKFRTAELKDIHALHTLMAAHPYLQGCHIISNSDAHYLEHIREPGLTIPAKDRTPEAVIAWLRGEY
ncbi:MAG: PHP domain-containing protein [Lachnospiraceae bacterium]|jgi:PHP family Zn ribbon phosphoesterase|nr:PHP domain-containing protein [Lachnospiraceae bacterium]